MKQLSDKKAAALRSALAGLTELYVIRLRKRIKAHPNSNSFTSVLGLELLASIFTDLAELRPAVEYSADDMVRLANETPAMVQLHDETGFKFVIGYSRGYKFAGTENVRFPELQVRRHK